MLSTTNSDLPPIIRSGRSTPVRVNSLELLKKRLSITKSTVELQREVSSFTKVFYKLCHAGPIIFIGNEGSF